MELDGVVRNGVIVPDDATALVEGMRVRISLAPPETPKPFGERYAQFKGAIPGLPTDLAEEQDHYRSSRRFGSQGEIGGDKGDMEIGRRGLR